MSDLKTVTSEHFPFQELTREDIPELEKRKKSMLKKVALADIFGDASLMVGAGLSTSLLVGTEALKQKGIDVNQTSNVVLYLVMNAVGIFTILQSGVVANISLSYAKDMKKIIEELKD